MSIETAIFSWVKETLSQPQSFLGDLPPCPYAADAVLRGQVNVTVVEPELAFEKIKTALSLFSSQSQRVHVIAVPDWQYLALEDVQFFVKICRNEFSPRNLWLLYDHPLSKEEVQDFSFNHGGLLLFFIQKLSDLVAASNELKKTAYYDKWSEEYKSQVVGVREQHYQKYLALKAQDSTFQPVISLNE